MSVCEEDTYLIFFWYKNIIKSSISIWPKHIHFTSKVFKLKLVAFESAKEIKKERKTYLWF